MARGFGWRLAAIAAVASAVLLWPSSGQAVNGCDVPVIGDVYQVSTAAHVQDLHNCSLDGDFVQTADIVMPAPTTSGGVTSNFTPFGDVANPFEGTYDGHGYFIRGLVYRDPGGENLGLFGVVALATFRGIRLEEVDIFGSDGVGGLAGYAANSGVRDVRVTGTIRAVPQSPALGTAGGVLGSGEWVGALAEPMALSDLEFVGRIEGEVYVAGIVGFAHLYVVGPHSATASVYSITRNRSSGEIIGDRWVGGLVGAYANGSASGFNGAPATMDESTSSASVQGTRLTGGLIGGLLALDGGETAVRNSYASGVVVQTSGTFDTLGGLLGGIWNSSAHTLALTYARGAVTRGGALVGGSSNSAGTTRASFWNPTASGLSTSSEGTESSQAAMRTPGLYRDAGWAIVDQWAAPAADRVWGICASVNDGYPFLLWEYAESPCAKPAAPTGVTVKPRDRSALVSFAEPAAGDAPITGYEYSVDDGASWSGFASARSVGPLRITGLRNGTAYQVRVRARNANGSGPASEAVRVVPGTRQFALSQPRRSSPYEVVVRMRVEGPGVASVVGTRAAGDRRRARVPVCRQVLRPKKAGTVVLRCRVNAATRVALRDGAVPVRLRIAYRPVGGSARVVTRSLRLPAYTPTPGPVTG